MQVEEGHLKFFLVEKIESLRTACERQRFHARGGQNLANHLANGFLVIHDQDLLLHVMCSWQWEGGDADLEKREGEVTVYLRLVKSKSTLLKKVERANY